MQTEPLLSVIIPAYNVERFIHEAVLSLQQQTLKQWEAVIIDDGSIDATEAAINKATTHDKRFKIITQENGGSAKARNNGAVNASTDFLFFMDADDRLSANYLRRVYNTIIEHPEVNIVYGRCMKFGAVEAEHILSEPSDNKSLILKPWLLLGAGYIMRRRVWQRVGGYPEDGLYKKGGQDNAFWIANALNDNTAIKLNNIFYYYRIHDDSITERRNLSIDIAIRRLDIKKYGEIMRHIGVSYAEYFSARFMYALKQSLYNKRYRDVIKITCSILRYNPTQKTALRYLKIVLLALTYGRLLKALGLKKR